MSAISGRFGAYTPQLCSSCCQDSLDILSKASAGKESDFLFRRMTVSSGCIRCAAALPFVYTTHTIALPRMLVTSALSLEMKAVANLRGGTKPPNAELQLATLVGDHKCDEAYKLALVQVGIEAIRTERRFVGRHMTLRIVTVVQFGFGAILCGGALRVAMLPCDWAGGFTPTIKVVRNTTAGLMVAMGACYFALGAVLTAASDYSTAWMCHKKFVFLRPMFSYWDWAVWCKNIIVPPHTPVYGPENRPRFDPRMCYPGALLCQGGWLLDSCAGRAMRTPERPVAAVSPSGAVAADLRAVTEETQPVDAGADVVSAVREAEASVRVMEQQACHMNRESIVAMPLTLVESTAEVSNTSTMPCEKIGSREAHPRFPHMGREVFLFQNGPHELESAEALRNKDVGKWEPHGREKVTLRAMVDDLISQLFTQANIDAALVGFEDYKQTLPSKFSESQKEKILQDIMNEALGDGADFSRVTDAFVKAEVSLKPKPRPIANHGVLRMIAMAKVAYVFEHVMFHAFIEASIKARPKKDAIVEILANFNKMQQGVIVENDLTAFEFGISEALKQAEQRIFRHISTLMSHDESINTAFSRVCNARDKAATWRLRFTDEAGVKCVFKLKLPNTMRESGDRFTSSGNWLQNLLAWGSFLAAPKSVSKAIGLMIKSKGRDFFYTSPRDGKDHLARLAFEGDDTLARLSEFVPPPPGMPDPIEQFFTRWGWKSKLKYASLTGDCVAQFVGYNVLVRGGKFVVDGSNDFVMLPRIKEVLCSKQWSMSAVSEEARAACTRIYAASMGAEFTRLEPMHSFFRAMWNDVTMPTTLRASELADARGCYLRTHGTMPTAEELEKFALEDASFAELLGTTPEHRLLAELSTGAASDEEWASMCGLTTLNMHGQDLRSYVPAAWVA